MKLALSGIHHLRFQPYSQSSWCDASKGTTRGRFKGATGGDEGVVLMHVDYEAQHGS